MRWMVAVLLSFQFAATVFAAGGDDVPMPTPKAGRTPELTGESRYQQAEALTARHEWRAAEATYREALQLKFDFPEAWNGLGHALKHQGRFDESIRAYEEALRLRPNYARAIEYLGEAYVLMGKLDKAQALHARLQTIDRALADELASAIAAGSSDW